MARGQPEQRCGWDDDPFAELDAAQKPRASFVSRTKYFLLFSFAVLALTLGAVLWGMEQPRGLSLEPEEGPVLSGAPGVKLLWPEESCGATILFFARGDLLQACGLAVDRAVVGLKLCDAQTGAAAMHMRGPCAAPLHVELWPCHCHAGKARAPGMMETRAN